MISFEWPPLQIRTLMEMLFEENDDLAPVHQLTLKCQVIAIHDACQHHTLILQNKVIKIDGKEIGTLPNIPATGAQLQPGAASATPLIVEYEEGCHASTLTQT